MLHLTKCAVWNVNHSWRRWQWQWKMEPTNQRAVSFTGLVGRWKFPLMRQMSEHLITSCQCQEPESLKQSFVFKVRNTTVNGSKLLPAECFSCTWNEVMASVMKCLMDVQTELCHHNRPLYHLCWDEAIWSWSVCEWPEPWQVWGSNIKSILVEIEGKIAFLRLVLTLYAEVSWYEV